MNDETMHDASTETLDPAGSTTGSAANPQPQPPHPNEDLPEAEEDKQSDLDVPGGKGVKRPESESDQAGQ